MSEEIKGIIGRGLLGVTGAGGGIGVSLVAVEQWLRLGSLVVGITVGLLTIVSLLKKFSKD